MSKELFTSERELATIKHARSFETDFYNRQSQLNDIPTPRQQLASELHRGRLLPRTTDGKTQTSQNATSTANGCRA